MYVHPSDNYPSVVVNTSSSVSPALVFLGELYNRPILNSSLSSSPFNVSFPASLSIANVSSPAPPFIMIPAFIVESLILSTNLSLVTGSLCTRAI